MADWEVKNKISYAPTGDDIDIFSLKVRDELELIYRLLNRLRRLDASAGDINDTVAFQLHADTASGRLLIRDAQNQNWIELGKLGQSFFGITPEDIGAVKNTGKANVDIAGSPDKILNYPIEVANFKTGDVLVLDTAKGKIVNMPKDEIKSSDVSATGEANKIVRLDSDGILHADISGSASILDGVAVSMSGAKDGQVLIYNGASKKIVPSTDISGSAQKVNGVGINPNSLVNGKAVAYDSKTKMLVADTNNYLLDSDVSDSSPVDQRIGIYADAVNFVRRAVNVR